MEPKQMSTFGGRAGGEMESEQMSTFGGRAGGGNLIQANQDIWRSGGRGKWNPSKRAHLAAGRAGVESKSMSTVDGRAGGGN